MKTMRILIMSVALSLSMSAMCQTAMQWGGKPSKEAIKETKRMKKDGWKVTIGEPPLERQLDDAYKYRYDRDEEGNRRYIVGVGQSHAQSYDVARIQAEENARAEIGRNIGSEVTNTVNNMLFNTQLANDKAESKSIIDAVVKTVSSQHLSGTEVVASAYRELPDKNKEVQIRLVAKSSDIRARAKNAARAELESRGIKINE